ncbi:sulfhydryl oxidase 2 [Polymixia lowei]
MARILWFNTVLLLSLMDSPGTGASRLYTEGDPVVILSSSNIKPTITNSSSAWMLQFYSSWCGHCIQYSSTWKELAQDVRDWDQAIRIAVLDCAQEDNFDICKEYGIHFYPTFRYLGAHSRPGDLGTTYRGADREIQTVRQLMINFLQNHTKLDRPDHCPSLEPYSSVELLPLLGQRSDHYTAFIIEEPQSYIGREVILDLVRYSGVVVRRALATDLPLVERVGITAFPSAYLLFPNGTHTHLHVHKRLRSFFSSVLRSLSGVQLKQVEDRKSGPGKKGVLTDPQPADSWRDFDSSKVYMADLESALHYLLRVELATHNTLQGEELKIFKDFVTIVAKLFPGRRCVLRVMETLLDWLVNLPVERVPYQAVLDLLDNKMRITGLFLGAELRWVGCQGSRAGLRGYPCALWTLFHILTVQYQARPNALANTALEGDPVVVLQVMRHYIRTFFGCDQCGSHFEQMAAESLDRVSSSQEAVLWLWNQHNRVNSRLAGSLSEDPLFPKSPWPSPSLCTSCHEEKDGVHIWNQEKVLAFLSQHYGAGNLSPQHLASPPPQSSQGEDSWQLGGGQRQQALKEEVLDGREGGKLGGGGGTRAGVRLESGSGGWILGFTSVDMSLCLLLYVCSCLLLMLLFFFFKIRSRRWKLRHNRLYV